MPLHIPQLLMSTFSSHDVLTTACQTPSHVLGFEASGEVTHTGKKVTKWQIK